jgi:hypothetical protein
VAEYPTVLKKKDQNNNNNNIEPAHKISRESVEKTDRHTKLLFSQAETEKLVNLENLGCSFNNFIFSNLSLEFKNILISVVDLDLA